MSPRPKRGSAGWFACLAVWSLRDTPTAHAVCVFLCLNHCPDRWHDARQVLREKIDMENQLEQEQEYIVNRLQKRLEAVESDKRCGQ